MHVCSTLVLLSGHNLIITIKKPPFFVNSVKSVYIAFFGADNLPIKLVILLDYFVL
jgi:hypothetical protein